MGNVTSSVAAKFAFFPPDPPTYDVYRDEEDGRLVMSGLTADKNVDVHLLDTKGGNKIVATFWKHPAGRFTILYSHGNAADLGQMQELFLELRAHLRVNIMRYVFEFMFLDHIFVGVKQIHVCIFYMPLCIMNVLISFFTIWIVVLMGYFSFL